MASRRTCCKTALATRCRRAPRSAGRDGNCDRPGLWGRTQEAEQRVAGGGGGRGGLGATHHLGQEVVAVAVAIYEVPNELQDGDDQRAEADRAGTPEATAQAAQYDARCARAEKVPRREGPGDGDVHRARHILPDPVEREHEEEHLSLHHSRLIRVDYLRGPLLVCVEAETHQHGPAHCWNERDRPQHDGTGVAAEEAQRYLEARAGKFDELPRRPVEIAEDEDPEDQQDA